VLFCGAHQIFATSRIAFTEECLVSKQPIISNLKINRRVNCLTLNRFTGLACLRKARHNEEGKSAAGECRRLRICQFLARFRHVATREPAQDTQAKVSPPGQALE